MITIRNLGKSFGERELFHCASLQINEGDRFALVGPNGSGKSTLFRMLVGESEPDSGEIAFRKGAIPGYMPQEIAPTSQKTVLEEALSGFDSPDERTAACAKKTLMGLGFKIPDFDKKTCELSGGWAMRVVLAGLLLKAPDILLLDEPTNHLDLDSLLWLEEHLKSYKGAVFVISHDRAFINSVCRAIISVEDAALKPYYGNYDFFLAEQAAKRERMEAAYKRQQDEIRRMQEFIDRNKARASTAGRAQSMIKRLEKMEILSPPAAGKALKMRFPQPQRTGVRVVTLKGIAKCYGELRVYHGLDFEIERGRKMALVGHNGAGKSTLLKLLAGVIPPDSGERILGLHVKTGYYSQHRAEMLDPQNTVFEEAAKTARSVPELTVRTILGTFLFPGDDAHKRVANLSGGEKSRLALVKLLLDPPNALFLDEPTTHLDLPSVEALVRALKEFEGALCFISHDVYFINELADHVVNVDKGKLTTYHGNYDYFLRRQESLAAEAPCAPAAPLAPEKNAGTKPKTDPRAEERKRRVRSRQVEKEIALLTRETGAARAKIETLTKMLEDPSSYGDFEKVRKLGEEIKTLQSEISDKETKLEILLKEQLT